VSNLVAELRELANDYAESKFDCSHTPTKIREAADEIQRLRAALEKYGQHGDGCPAWDAEPCTCGFEALRGAGEK
jgi:hypothetical protein